MNEETIKMLNIINNKIKKCKKDNNCNDDALFIIPLGCYGDFGYLTDKMLNEAIAIQQENARLKDKIEKYIEIIENLYSEKEISKYQYEKYMSIAKEN